MADNSAKSSSISFSGVLTIVFIVLKLTGSIDWSWWWVVAPLWLPITVAVVIFLFVGLIGIAIETWLKK
jgi:hypothetical protein